MSEYKRYCLTLAVADPSARDRFRALSRPESFFEIRPNRSPGQRGAYSVEMTQDEYEAALEDAADPDVNLIVVEPDYAVGESSVVPGTTANNYMAAQDADSLGLTGQGVDVGIIERGYGPMLNSVMSGRVKAAKGFGRVTFEDGSQGNLVDPYSADDGHGALMIGLAVPNKSRAVAAAYDGHVSTFAAAIYWMSDEIGVNIISISQWIVGVLTVLTDALNHAYGKGTLIFASAGNGTNNNAIPTTNITFPASLPNVLAISNYRPSTDSIDSTSNYGSKIWAAAAGSSLSAYDPNGNVVALDNGGTSAAAALSAGMAARLATGGTSLGSVKKYLAETARKTNAGPLKEGNGILQLAAAYNKMKGIAPPKTNADGSIPLPNGGQVSPTDGSIPGGLPPSTTVYPTGEVEAGAGTFTLPQGGAAQFGSGVPLPEGYSGGPYPLGENTQVTPDAGAGTDPAPTPGACQEQDDEEAGAEEPPVGYWVYVDEISAEAVSQLTTSAEPWSYQTDGIRPWITAGSIPCQFYDKDHNATQVAVLQGLGWWHTGYQLMRLCPPNSWWRTF